MKAYLVKFDTRTVTYVDSVKVLANNVEQAISKAKKYAKKENLKYVIGSVELITVIDF